MEEIVRKTKFLGNYKTIVGDGKTDIVLNTLGKVYILTGNNFKLINKLFEQLDKINLKDVEEIKKSVIISSDLENLEYPGDGILIFNPNKEILYISYQERYILLLSPQDINDDYESNSSEYVLKKGDIMTGPLHIYTEEAPLVVASKNLINNLNAEFVNGYSSKDMAMKTKEEIILKLWEFQEDTNFIGDINANKIKVLQHIGSKEYTPGYLGKGWQLNSFDNSLTIDYLIVRKAMQVYELIINDVSATNGTFWVTDTCKVKNAYKVETCEKFSSLLQPGIWYIPNVPNNINLKKISNEHLSEPNNVYLPNHTDFLNYGYLINVKNSEVFNSLTTLDLTNPDSWTEEIKSNVKCKSFFNGSTLNNNADVNSIYEEISTPYFLSTLETPISSIKDIKKVYVYYKYFGITKDKKVSNIRIIETDPDKYPSIRVGDIVRCQKFKDNRVKYYDALVAAKVDTYQFVLILAPQVFDKYSKDNKEEININPYNKGSKNISQEDLNSEIQENPNSILSDIEGGDSLVRIGSINDISRQGSMFISSSEPDSPTLKVLDEVNRPDFNVIYYTPKFKTITYLGRKWYYKEAPGGLVINNKSVHLFPIPTIECEMYKNSNGEILTEPLKNLKTQLGKLDGIKNPDLETNQPHGYGLYGENVYLTGEFILASTGENVKTKIEAGHDLIKLLVENDLSKTGINISQGKIIVNADLFEIKNTKNTDTIAAFKLDANGQISLNTEQINADKIRAKDVNISGNIEANTGYFSGPIKHKFFEITAEDGHTKENDIDNLLKKGVVKRVDGGFIFDLEKTGMFLKFTGTLEAWQNYIGGTTLFIYLPVYTTDPSKLQQINGSTYIKVTDALNTKNDIKALEFISNYLIVDNDIPLGTVQNPNFLYIDIVTISNIHEVRSQRIAFGKCAYKTFGAPSAEGQMGGNTFRNWLVDWIIEKSLKDPLLIASL